MPFWNPNSLGYVIEWDAWATFVVGLAAVAGAVWVGLRQAGISSRQADIANKQTDILAAQVRLEGQRFRGELFDRRMAVFEQVMALCADMLDPHSKEGFEQSNFMRLAYRSRSLFDPEVYNLLVDVNAVALSIYVARLRLHTIIEHPHFGNFVDAFKEFHELGTGVRDLRAQMIPKMSAYLRIDEPKPALVGETLVPDQKSEK